MAILQITTNVTGLAGVSPRIIYLETSDTIVQVTTTGYLNDAVHQGYIFYTTDIALVSTRSTPTADPIGEFYQVTHTSGNWSLELLPSSGGVNPGTENDLAYYATTGSYVSPLTTANSSMLRTTSAGVPGWSGAMTNGQLMIGSTGATPTPATLTAGSGIQITNGAGSISITSTDSGMEWEGIAGTSQPADNNMGYVVQNAGQTTITLPATSVLGDRIAVQGLGAAGWILTANAGQTIQVGSSATSTAGTVTSTNQWDSIEVVAVVANTTWSATRVYSAGVTIA